MIKKNKELEYQAMKMVNKDEKEPIDKYEADLHYAIALSQKMQEEYEAAIRAEEDTFKRVLEESRRAYEEE